MQKKEKHVQNICFIKTIKNKQAKTTTNKNKEKVNKLGKAFRLMHDFMLFCIPRKPMADPA